MKNQLLLLIILSSFLGCSENDFSPIGNYEKKIVTYSILDNRINCQIFKVQSCYLINNSINKKISNLKVSISDGFNTFYFKDTLINNSENYSYVKLDNFVPLRGTFYSLSISGDDVPTATSKIVIPGKTDVTLYYDSDKIQLTYYRTKYVKGYLYHLYVDFYIKEGNKIINNYRVEVPTEIILQNDEKDTLEIYPSLTKSTSFQYSYANLYNTLIKYKPKDDKHKLVVKRSIATVLSLEENLYNYVSTVKGFSDPFSVRLDQISYSNIINGYGIFGAITIDSTMEKIPAYIIQSFGLETE